MRLRLKRVDQHYLRSGVLKVAHTWVARFFCIYLTYKWFMFSTDSDVYNRHAFRTVVTMVPKVFALYILGLWLSTTKWGVRHKQLLYIMLLPSLLMSTPLVGFPFNFTGWVAFLVVLWSYMTVYSEVEAAI